MHCAHTVAQIYSMLIVLCMLSYLIFPADLIIINAHIFPCVCFFESHHNNFQRVLNPLTLKHSEYTLS